MIAKYAPKQMDAAEVKTYLEEKFADVIATKNKGQIMKAVMADMKGKAERKGELIRLWQNSANNVLS